MRGSAHIWEAMAHIKVERQLTAMQEADRTVLLP
jgi:hypothetical protein